MAHAPARPILSRLACLASSRRRLASSTTGGGLRRGERIRTGTRNPPPPSGAQPSSFSCADTGIHAPSRRDLAPQRDPHRDTRPFPQCPYPPTMPVLNLSKGPPPNPGVVRPGSPARFTSKCRKMSQNVALFHTSAPRLRNLRVKNLTFLAKNRPFWPIFVHSRVRKCRTDRPSVASSPGEPGGGLRRGGPSPAETCRKLAAAGVCFNGCRLRPPRRTTSLRYRRGELRRAEIKEESRANCRAERPNHSRGPRYADGRAHAAATGSPSPGCPS